MSILLLVVGVTLLLIVFAEMLWTTMGIGSGIITKYLSGYVGRFLVAIHSFRPSHLLLTWGGIIILLMVFCSWVFLLWAGWSCIFIASDTSVVHTYDDRAPGVWDQVYFIGFTISTLGVGDFAPQGTLWQVLTALASLSGLFLVTFSVTYLVPIVSAVTDARKTAVHISSLGLNPYEIVLHNYPTEHRRELGAQMQTITANLLSLEQQHLTYPILHHFHIPLRPESIVLSVAMLDEALSIIAFSTDEGHKLEGPSFRVARQSITEFLDTLGKSLVPATGEAPPVPSMQPLYEADFLDIDEETIQERFRSIEDRRRRLLQLVETEGWSWDDVYNRTGDRRGQVPLNYSESSAESGTMSR